MQCNVALFQQHHTFGVNECARFDPVEIDARGDASSLVIESIPSHTVSPRPATSYTTKRT